MMWLLTSMGNPENGDPDHRRWLVIVTMALAGAGQAFSQGSLSGLCATCPERYTRAFVVGLGCSSVLVSLLKLVSKGAFRDPQLCERIWLWELVVLYVAGISTYLFV